MKPISSFLKSARSLAAIPVSAVIISCSGCASADVDVLSRPQTQLLKPDFVLVYDCAVSAGEVNLDHGFAQTAIRDASDANPTEQEIQLGHEIAKTLTDGIVENLRLAGIRAGKASDGYKPSNSTLVVTGKFIRIDQGNQTLRVWVGFGLGNGDIQALMECSQSGKTIARGMVTTSGSFKPGLAVPVAGGAAAGTILVSSAIGAGVSGFSETFMSTVKADTTRAAKEVAKKLVQGYINRGWASPDAMDKINSFF